MGIIEELRDRKVIRTAAIYVAIAWGATEIVVTATDTLELPVWVSRITMLAFVVGFPLAIAYSWFRDLGRVGLSLVLVAAMVVGTGGLYLTMFPKTGGEMHEPLPAPDPFRQSRASIAVLPFSIIDVTDEAALGTGIAADILSRLARVPGMRVNAHRSAVIAAERNLTVGEIGSSLGVEHVVEGRIRRARDGLRIETTLFDARTEYLLWSGETVWPADAIGSAPGRIASDLALALGLDGTGLPEERAAVDPEAYRLYLRSLYAMQTDYVTAEAISGLRKAVALAPAFAEAWAALGSAYSRAVAAGMTEVESGFAKRQSALERALQADPRLPQAYELLGESERNRGDAAAAEAAFRRALELNPNSATAHLRLGRIFRNQGFLRAADRQYEIAYSLDPLSDLVDAYKAAVLMNRGEVGQALQLLKDMLAEDPRDSLALDHLQLYSILLGSPGESLEWFGRMESLDVTTAWNYGLAALAHARLGDRDSALAALEEGGAASTRNFWLRHALFNRLYLDGDGAGLLQRAEAALEDGTSRNLRSWAGLGALLTGEPVRAVEYLESAFHDRAWFQGNFPAAEIVDLANLVLAYRALGDRAQADKALERCRFRIRRLRAQDVWLPDLDYAEGVVRVLEGDVEDGIALLTKAATRGWLAYPVMRVDPKLEAIRSTAAFESLVADAKAALVTDD